MTDLRYPVGTLTYDSDITPGKRTAWIRQIAEAPAALRAAVARLTEARLDLPYRPGGWTARQVVHHVPDSHLNAYIRFKWTLTEDNPTIKPYNQAAWATLADTRLTPVGASLDLLDAVHRRWVVLLESLKAEDWARPLVHPENGPMTLDQLLQLYAWHGRHHVAHVESLIPNP
ncbi:MAG TPA: putative metal-dependent hydrolase [Vicinamibacterales bacterium]|nr:putative metal-dependent hydrolase [Vicinamibacterales bacterium]